MEAVDYYDVGECQTNGQARRESPSRRAARTNDHVAACGRASRFTGW